jgi:hypothetical protein
VQPATGGTALDWHIYALCRCKLVAACVWPSCLQARFAHTLQHVAHECGMAWFFIHMHAHMHHALLILRARGLIEEPSEALAASCREAVIAAADRVRAQEMFPEAIVAVQETLTRTVADLAREQLGSNVTLRVRAPGMLRAAAIRRRSRQQITCITCTHESEVYSYSQDCSWQARKAS